MIYNGGQDGVLASKELVQLEVESATTPLLEKLKRTNHIPNLQSM